VINSKNSTSHNTHHYIYIVLLCLCPFLSFSQQAQWASFLQHSESLIKTHPDSAFVILKDLVSTARQQKDPLTEATCLQQIGHILYNYGNYSQAVDHLLQAEKIFRDIDQKEKLARNLNLLGSVYYSNKQAHLSQRLFNEALKLSIEMKNGNGIAQTYGNIGHLYEKRLLYDSAFFFQQKALFTYQEAGDSMGMAKIFENIGSIYEDWQKYDSARMYFENALRINLHYHDEIAQIEILNNLGDVHRKTGRYREGLAFTRQALQLAETTQAQYQLASAYRDMARGYELLHIYDSAYYYNELSRTLVEDIYSNANNRQIALLETIYDVDMKNNQIAKMALDKKINVLITMASVIGTALLLILGAMVISRQRLKISKEKAINTQNKEIYEKGRELMQVELKNKQLEEEKLKSSLEMRSKELSAHTLHLIQKNQLLEELKSRLNEIVSDDKRDQRKQLKQLVQKINLNFSQDSYWDDFRAIFDQVHQTFFTNLKQHADHLTPGELRMIALLRMNLSSSDMATLLGISQDSLRVARYRLRKKLNLSEGESLTAFIQGL
jgi:tetratricopeptide (TPR) repeat protein